MPYFRVTGYQPPYLAPRYSAKSVMSRSLPGNLNGSSFVPIMMSGPPPMLAATAALGRMSSQLSASTRIFTSVCSTNFLVLTIKLSNSGWTNCFHRSTLISAPGSGAGPFQVGAALAKSLGKRAAVTVAPPAFKASRLVMSFMGILPCCASTSHRRSNSLVRSKPEIRSSAQSAWPASEPAHKYARYRGPNDGPHMALVVEWSLRSRLRFSLLENDRSRDIYHEKQSGQSKPA